MIKIPFRKFYIITAFTLGTFLAIGESLGEPPYERYGRYHHKERIDCPKRLSGETIRDLVRGDIVRTKNKRLELVRISDNLRRIEMYNHIHANLKSENKRHHYSVCKYRVHAETQILPGIELSKKMEMTVRVERRD